MASSTRQLEYRVGLLIVAGLITAMVLVLISDRDSFTGSYRVTAYLDDAGGLRTSSPVTLSGLRVGEVQAISPIHDPRGNIRVVMSILDTYPLPQSYSLQLASNGLLGDSYLAFTDVGPGAGHLPMDGTAAVKASQGFFDEASAAARRILAAVDTILNAQTRGDVKRLVHNAAVISEDGAGLVRDLHQQTARLQAIFDHLETLETDVDSRVRALGDHVDRSLVGVDHGVADLDQTLTAMGGHADDLSRDASISLARLDGLMATTGDLLHASKPGILDALAQISRLGKSLAGIAEDIQHGHGILGQMLSNPALARNLNTVAIDLQLTSDLITAHPEALVFGRSRSQIRALKAERERLLMARAYHEGYYARPADHPPAPAAGASTAVPAPGSPTPP